MASNSCDFLIIGAGVIGLATGIALLEANPRLKVVIAEKESRIGEHASGRNSGVLHAGFYYTPDSLKAKFCREGNRELRKLANKYGIPLLNCGKVVVSRNNEEDRQLSFLYQRGLVNGVDVELLDAAKLKNYEPLAVTNESFLWSPTSAVSDPIAIINALRKEFMSLGGVIRFNTKIKLYKNNNEIIDANNNFSDTYFINAAGAYSDIIARNIEVGTDYSVIPFAGLYRITKVENLPLRTLVYPLPHAINPFLGVHFTLTIDNKVKIGPSAIPIIGREQYSIFQNWSFFDSLQTIKSIHSLIKGESHSLSTMIRTELPNFFTFSLLNESKELVPSAGSVKKWHKKPPGIRSQLVHLPTGSLEQDFVIRKSLNSTHILNAVSPGWTSAIPFGRFVAQTLI